MKYSFAILFLLLMLLLGCQADATGWFKVIDVTPIEMTANSEANFTVSVKGLGGERAYVELVFRNKSEGFGFNCPKMIKNVFPAGVTKYNCTVKAGDVAVGNYSFVVDTAAAGARPGKMSSYINVVEEMSPKDTLHDSTIEYQRDRINAANSKPEEAALSNQSSQQGHTAPVKEEAAKTPMVGAAGAILALLIVLRRMKR